MNRDRKPILSKAVAALSLAAIWSLGFQTSVFADTAYSGSILKRETLTGDWGGLRTELASKGVDITVNYIGEGLRVVSGGIKRSNSYQGQIELSIDTDLEKAFGWKGGKFHVTAYNLHNKGGIIAEKSGSISDPSNISGLRSNRLFTLWLEQNFLDDRLSIRAGQLAADEEFFTSPTAEGLINGTFGWASLLSENMTQGGPAYPLTSPGLRLKLQPTENLTAMVGLFSDYPAGRQCLSEPQECNRHGFKFSRKGSPLWVGELQYGINQGEDSHNLAGVYKIGAWYSRNMFDDMYYGLNKSGATVSIHNPAMDKPFQHKGNWGVYGVVDQTVWNSNSRSMSVFLRGGLSPKNRNLVSYYADAGLGFKGLISGRPDDTLTIGVAYTKISPEARNADRYASHFTNTSYIARNSEIAYELNYAAQITPWLTLQPNLQYIVRPNGGQNPTNADNKIKRAIIAGLRTTIVF